jgi:nucleotide-binding universal stress UspA family protein
MYRPSRKRPPSPLPEARCRFYRWKHGKIKKEETMEKILIPLDGSIHGEAALRYVENLIAGLKPQQKPECILFHVVNMEPHVVSTSFSVEPYTVKETDQAANEALCYLQKAGEALKSRGIKVGYEVARGKIIDEIVKAEKEFGADLVVIAAHGQSGIGHWAFGNIAEKVLRSGTLPVLMVRE